MGRPPVIPVEKKTRIVVSPTANKHDAVEAVQKALDETEQLLGHR